MPIVLNAFSLKVPELELEARNLLYVLLAPGGIAAEPTTQTADTWVQNSNYHLQNDLDRLKKAFGRLLGGDWPDAWKISGHYTLKPKTGYYGNRSVFEVGSVDETDNDD